MNCLKIMLQISNPTSQLCAIDIYDTRVFGSICRSAGASEVLMQVQVIAVSGNVACSYKTSESDHVPTHCILKSALDQFVRVLYS